MDPRRRNTTDFQKTLGMNNWYVAGPGNPCPLGNLQMLGKIQGPMVKAGRPWLPMPVLTYMTNHSIDIYLTTEAPVSPPRLLSIRLSPSPRTPCGSLRSAT